MSKVLPIFAGESAIMIPADIIVNYFLLHICKNVIEFHLYIYIFKLPWYVIYEVMKGWKGSVVGLRKMNDFPQEARDYISKLEKLIKCPIILISTSPERSDTILIENPF